MTPADFRELAGLFPKYDLFRVLQIGDPRTFRRMKSGVAPIGPDQEARLIDAAGKILADRLLETLAVATSGLSNKSPVTLVVRLSDRVLRIEGRHFSDDISAALREAVQKHLRAGGMILTE